MHDQQDQVGSGGLYRDNNEPAPAASNHPPVATSPEEAAAVVAALEQFMRDPAFEPAPPSTRRSAWARASLLEATGRAEDVSWAR